MVTIIPFAAALDPERVGAIAALVLRAAYEVGIPSKEKLSLHLEMQKAQLHRQFNAEGHLSLSKMATHMPREFWSEFGWALILEYGMPRRLRKAAHLFFALVGHRRALRAGKREAA